VLFVSDPHVAIDPIRTTGRVAQFRRSFVVAIAVVLSLFVAACGDASVPEPAAGAGGQSEPDAGEPAPAASPEVLDAGEPSPTKLSDEADRGERAPEAPTETPTLVASVDPAPVGRPPAPNARSAPAVATTALGLAEQIIAAETGLRDSASTASQRADFGHLHQVAIRKLGYEPAWDTVIFEALPPELLEPTLLHVSARRALIDLSSGYDAADFIPAWAIIEPESMDELLSHYQAAEAATGIEWEYLAAINLIETGMGRIRGLSSAGAQGPMQFLPTTWAEAGIGEGDINAPADAIAGAARYLVRRGGPSDMAGAIWGYNNSDNYVTAVQAYAELLRNDPAGLAAIYNWEIYFFTELGDIWLPTGFSTPESIDLDDYLAANPWSAPDPGLR